MKKLLAVLGLLGLCLVPVAVRASAQDFTIDSFEAHYYLLRQTDGVAELRVRETIVADIPTIDQNHGILRAIPKTYQGHSVELQIQKVLTSEGKDWPYETYTENDNLVLKIGDADTYLQPGLHTFTIDYTLRGVTLTLSDRQEFYWDVNGVYWDQPFRRVVATLTVDPAIAHTMQPNVACYTGAAGSSATDCTVKPEGNVLTFTTNKQLARGEGLTIAASFAPGTFAEYKPSAAELWRLVGLVALFGLPPLLALIGAITHWRRYGRDPKGRGVVVPQYLPPKELSVLQSSAILQQGFQTKAISATIVDLAVRHYVKIYETKEKKLLKETTTYELELVKSPANLRSEEQAVINVLFETKTVGERVAIARLERKLFVVVHQIGASVDRMLVSMGYFRTTPGKARAGMMTLAVLLFIPGLIFVPWSLGFVAAAAILFVVSFAMPARTLKGVDMRDYLFGLRDYIHLAEADRLKILQSPHGDLTEKIDINNKTQLIKLYERLLPYAILFNFEKEWAKEFAGLYTQPPDWYGGASTFNAVYFASAISGLSTTVTSSFTPPTDSSSGGSGGGGSSGGGGGGGGGGGW